MSSPPNMTRCHWIFYVFRLYLPLFHWIFVVFSFLVSINSLLLSNQRCIEFSTTCSNWVGSGLSTNLTCNGLAQKKKKKKKKEVVRCLGPRDPHLPHLLPTTQFQNGSSLGPVSSSTRPVKIVTYVHFWTCVII